MGVVYVLRMLHHFLSISLESDCTMVSANIFQLGVVGSQIWSKFQYLYVQLSSGSIYRSPVAKQFRLILKIRGIGNLARDAYNPACILFTRGLNRDELRPLLAALVRCSYHVICWSLSRKKEQSSSTSLFENLHSPFPIFIEYAKYPLQALHFFSYVMTFRPS